MEKKMLQASNFNVKHWIDSNGTKSSPIELVDFDNQFKVLFCFQSWCPGCHSKGFPSLVKMVDELKGNKEIAFFAIQTVFEGFEENTLAKINEMQTKYNLAIPFGHDAGKDDKSKSIFMENYQTGGTPWFILIDKKNNVVFSDFHLNVEAAIDFLKTQ